MPGLSQLIQLRIDNVEADVKDHEVRLRALEKWTAWIGGGMAVVQVLGQVVWTVLKAMGVLH